jgi:hypothetical protein
MHIYPYLNGIGSRNVDYGATPSSLPIELLEEILTIAWLSKMSPDRRRTFAISMILVSKLWMEIFRRVSTQHVYVLSSESLENWKRVFQGPILHSCYPIRQDNYPTNLCSSVTRQNSARQGYRQWTPYRQLLSIFHALPYLPNLRALSSEYFTPGASCLEDVSLPVVRLGLEYTFHPDTYTWIIDALLLPHSGPKHVPWALPELELISTTNNNPSSIGAVLEQFTHLEVPNDRNLKLGVRILSSSAHIPENCAIVHGPVSTFRALSIPYRSIPCRESRFRFGKEFPSRMVHGMGVGIVLDVGSARGRSNVVDPSNTMRSGHVFMQRRRN